LQSLPPLARLVVATSDPSVYATAKAALPTTPVGALVTSTIPTGVDFLVAAQSLGAQSVPVYLDGATTLSPCDFTISGALVDDPSVLKAAVVALQRGATICPGVAVPAVASTLEFPTAPSQPLLLGCAHDCLYLVTLDDANGKPVVATRGSLRGGFAPVAVTVPQAKLKPGTYRFDVRLVSQVNPGPVLQQTSPPLSAG
ncbi:MAG TPA: hypothetical protein VGU02_04600, partial [Gaiellaceae bacterium]|nr:hypothetical protein [Gaiellaceae bacterium]